MVLPARIQEAKTEATEARLAALTRPEGAGWITEARRAAEDRVRRLGLPNRRDEYWKFTRPDTLVQPETPEAAMFEDTAQPAFDGIDQLRLVFVDGVFDPDASDDPALAGVEIERLETAAAADIHWAKDLYGVLEANGQAPVARTLAALNTGFARDGVLLRVTGRAARPVSLIYRRKTVSSDAMLHHLVKIEPGAEATLLEAGPAAARLNTVLEVDVGDGGAFHHVRVQGRDHERRAATHVFARLGRESLFKSFTLTANGALTRNEAVVEFAGDDASAHVAGAVMGDGAFHQDDTVFITHDAENCESRQVFKKVLKNGAHGVFQGKILVKSGAQHTDGYQIGQTLLLDEKSQSFAKPELEIYADDVQCSHGSTTGAVDEDALFYLRARGIPREEAENLVVLAFLAQAIQEIADPDLAEDIRGRLEAWLRRH